MRLTQPSQMIPVEAWYPREFSLKPEKCESTRRKWTAGDKFRIGCSAGWGWGVLVKTSLPAMAGHLVYIYAFTEAPYPEPSRDLQRLLIAPIIVATAVFDMGVLHYIDSIGFAPGEIPETHYFRILGNTRPYVDERRRPATPPVGALVSGASIHGSESLLAAIFDPRLRLDHPDLPPNTLPPSPPVFDPTPEPPDTPEPPGPISVTLHVPDLLSPLDRGEDLEDPLDEALRAAGVGLVSGGGSDMERGSEVHIELIDEARGLPALRAALGALTLPDGAWLTIAGRRLEIRE